MWFYTMLQTRSTTVQKEHVILAYKERLTLSPHQCHSNVRHVTIVRQESVVLEYVLKTCFIFQAEDKDDAIHPVRKLQGKME